MNLIRWFQMTNELQALLDAMNASNANSFSPAYGGYEITETRRRYHLLNAILTNRQRSGVFLIDIKTNEVFKSKSYGKAGRFVGTVASITAAYSPRP